MPHKAFPQSHALMWSTRHYHPFPGAIPVYGAGRSRITHPFATLAKQQAARIPFDLHVLSTPPAFILSQNRTLHKKPFAKDIRQMTLKTNRRGTVIRKPSSQNLTPHYHLSMTRQNNRAWNELAIIDYKEVVQTHS